MNFKPILLGVSLMIGARCGAMDNQVHQRQHSVELVQLQQQLDHVQGAVIGAALGDAAGRLTEFMTTRQAITNSFQNFEDLLQKSHIQAVIPYTDDTVMARIVFESALKHRNSSSYDLVKDVAERFIELFEKGQALDPNMQLRAHGTQNTTASNELCELKTQMGHNNNAWWLHRRNTPVIKEGGCGSVMRVWPLGLVFHDDIKKITSLAQAQSEITHRAPIACIASVAMAVGVAHAYNEESVENVAQEMMKAADEIEKEMFHERYLKIEAGRMEEAWLAECRQKIACNKLSPSQMIQYAVYAALAGQAPDQVLGTDNQKNADHRSPNGFLLGWAADEAVAAAIYLFVRHCKTDPEIVNHANTTPLKAALWEGACAPGDSDSIASLAGALIGAKLGLSGQLPETLYQNLENREELLQLAEKKVLLEVQSKHHPTDEFERFIQDQRKHRGKEAQAQNSYFTAEHKLVFGAGLAICIGAGKELWKRNGPALKAWYKQKKFKGW